MPYTTLIPKPLVPLGGKCSILEVVIMQLRQAGFQHITLAVNHLSHLIMSYFGDGSRLNVHIDYSLEDTPLSTIGPLTLIKDLPENFLVMNGDILCDLDYASFFQQHCDSKSAVTVASYNRQTKIDFGVLEISSENNLLKFIEKPVYNFRVSMGIYCLSLGIIRNLPFGKPYGFDELMINGINSNLNISIYPFDGYWLDIGRPDDYEYADQNFEYLVRKLNIGDL